MTFGTLLVCVTLAFAVTCWCTSSCIPPLSLSSLLFPLCSVSSVLLSLTLLCFSLGNAYDNYFPPTQANAFQRNYAGGGIDAYYMQLNVAGTYYGVM